MGQWTLFRWTSVSCGLQGHRPCDWQQLWRRPSHSPRHHPTPRSAMAVASPCIVNHATTKRCRRHNAAVTQLQDSARVGEEMKALERDRQAGHSTTSELPQTIGRRASTRASTCRRRGCRRHRRIPIVTHRRAYLNTTTVSSHSSLANTQPPCTTTPVKDPSPTVASRSPVLLNTRRQLLP